MSAVAQLDQTAAAYDRLAPYYDEFTCGYAHAEWVAAIERRAVKLGLRGRRAIDIACGTGKSTAALLALGYSVRACDISAGMVLEAQQKLPSYAEAFFVADMRELPPLGEFDFVLCLDDAINYLLSDDELATTFSGAAALLSPSGVFAFDVNSIQTYRTSFAQTLVREGDGLFFAWRGEGAATAAPGQLASAMVETFAERADGLWERSSSRHVQRHHRQDVVRAELARAGLECCAVAGQLAVDEDRQIKLVYFARRADRHSESEEVSRVHIISP